MDNEVNAYSCVVVRKRKGTLKTKKWRDLKVGEIVKLTSGQVIPADLVLLSTSEQLGIGKHYKQLWHLLINN